MKAAVNSQDRREQRVKNALRIVLHIKNGAKYVEYAKANAKDGLNLTNEKLHWQVKMVLNNLQYWRGHVARRVKQTLRSFEEK